MQRRTFIKNTQILLKNQHAATTRLFLQKVRPKKYIYICVFQVSRPYLGFCLDPKHFIVNCEQNVVKAVK